MFPRQIKAKSLVKKPFKKQKIFILILLLSTMSASLFFVGRAPLAFAKERYAELQIFTKVLNLVQQYYVEEVDTKKLIYGGIKGMLGELDPHTNFLAPDIYKEFENETSGEFGGIGIEITLQNDILTVISPIEDTPAWIAGIQAGDKIIEINGVSTKGLSLAEAAQRMHGKNGSKVRLGIFRDGFDKPKEFTVVRGVVKIHSVKYTDLDDGFGYIRLTSFIETSATEMEAVLKKMSKSANGIKGVVIDLRRNPGGLLEQAIKISDLFLESGVIVSTIGRNQKDKQIAYAKKEGTYSGFPMVLLVNEYSASAAEIFAGAMQDNKRALIMGQTTYGKGSVQSVVQLGDGSGLKLTVARYFTPSGKSIQAEGIKPDILLDEVDAEAFRKAIIHHDAHREQDMQNHLLGDREQREINDKENKGPHAKDRSLEEVAVNYWWSKDAQKIKNANPKEKLLSEDFETLQAFNYLKAWRAISTSMMPVAAASSGTAPLAAERSTDSGEKSQNSNQPSKKTKK